MLITGSALKLERVNGGGASGGERENGLEKKMATTLPTVFVFVMCMTDHHCEAVQPVSEYIQNLC
jgi:hypothetical protein